MKMIRIQYPNTLNLPPSVCAIGYFDGLHRGHQELIRLAEQKAQSLHVKSAVLTFDPDPWTILHPGEDLSHLSDLKDKCSLLEGMGIDLFYVVEFSKEFAALSVEAFHRFLVSLNIKELVCGFDFTYGFKGKGTGETLRQCPEFVTDVVLEVSEDHQKISSTRIEQLIRRGEVEKANELLGYFYSLGGIIEHGFERGRQMGFPTANLQVSKEAVLPASGVYAGFVLVEDQMMAAMINVGTNPTFSNEKRTVEANILGRNLDLYGCSSRFFFVGRLREEKKFTSMEDLKEQLIRDQKAVGPVLERNQKLFSPTAKLWSLAGVDGILFK